MRLLIAEDDVQLGRTLAKGLREHAYAVDTATDGPRAAYLASVNEYDAIILDVMIPGRDGFAVCRELRARGVRSPVLMLTARDSVADKITGLDAGGDDYLTKPFEFAELLARLRALMRRRQELLPSVLTIGDLRIDTARQSVERAGEPVTLTTKEYALLEFLAQRAGSVIGRAEIVAHVWDENHDPCSNAIEVYINRLRRKFDRAGLRPLIHTRRGAGYLLDAGQGDAPSAR
jgi:DNA-binding response OmpR family regulator